ncbi:MAG: biopolymer transporter ExbD [Bacteroidales bacterium]|jgi:biopolymer transport protein ExbD|nr:biopolymer transporter ExbD [Bacteroidales bacterium]
MAKIRKDGKKTPPPISTASLPDIVFMLLFFFMVSTTMRESSLMVKKPMLPQATEITKLEKKSLVSNIYVAPPTKEYESIYGTQPVIQLNDAIEEVSSIPQFIQKEREARNPNERPLMSVSLKADSDTKMGIISDVKMELRRINSLKLNYAAREKQ